MPQLNKGGKFIFGRSVIREDGSVQLPEQAVREYDIAAEGKAYLFTGSRSTGGFCVTRKGLLVPSKLCFILQQLPELRDYTVQPGVFSAIKAGPIAGQRFRKRGKSGCPLLCCSF